MSSLRACSSLPIQTIQIVSSTLTPHAHEKPTVRMLIDAERRASLHYNASHSATHSGGEGVFALIDETLTNLKVPLVNPWKRKVDEPDRYTWKAFEFSSG